MLSSEIYAAGNYVFKVNNRDTTTRCERCSKLKITCLTPHPSHSIINFDQVNADWVSELTHLV